MNAGTCQFNTSGVNTPQGLAYEDPSMELIRAETSWRSRTPFRLTTFQTVDFADGTEPLAGGAACNAFGTGSCTGPGTPLACCTGLATGTCAGMVVGTIAEFDTKTLTTGTPGYNDTVEPFNNSPVCTLPAIEIPPDYDEPPTSCPIGSVNNATIGGCNTFLSARSLSRRMRVASCSP